MGHGPSLIPDETLFIQLTLFFITYFILKHLVFKPYLKLFELRKSRTLGALENAKKMADKANEIKSHYENKILQAREKNADIFLIEQRKILDEERRIINAAKKEAETFLQNRIEEIRKEAAINRNKLMHSVPDFSKQMVLKLFNLPKKAHAIGKKEGIKEF